MLNFFLNKINQLKTPKLVYKDLNFDGKTYEPYFKELCTYEQVNLIISKIIKDDKPAIVSRLGASELKTVNNYLVNRASSYGKFNESILNELYTHSGVYPISEEVAVRFSKLYINAIRNIDVIGVWNNIGENQLLEFLTPNVELADLSHLEPFFIKENAPWTKWLTGKKILVIHPFKKTIEKQYAIRKKLFDNQELLPDFDLITIEAIQSLSGNSRFNNWFSALAFMKTEIDKLDFDIAIIGAGAYGLPLADYVKQKSKIAIHLGGATQLMFGIKGKRWMDIASHKALMNEYWTFPDKSEKPEHAHKVDGVGAYWQ